MTNPYAKPPTVSDDYRLTDFYREAAEIFFERGFQAATMADIAESVDLSKGGLYYYVKGKKALLFAIMSYALDLLETRVLGPARRLEDPGECLQLLVGGYVNLIFEERSVMALLDESAEHLEPAHQARVRSRQRLFDDFLRDVFAARFYDLGRGGELDATEAARSALGMIRSVRRWIGRTGPERPAVVAHIIKRAENGFSAPEPAALAS